MAWYVIHNSLLSKSMMTMFNDATWHNKAQAGKLVLAEWKFGWVSGKQAWVSGILYRLYKRLPNSG